MRLDETLRVGDYRSAACEDDCTLIGRESLRVRVRVRLRARLRVRVKTTAR